MSPPRQPTHMGPRNEDRSHVPIAPRGVGLTEPPDNQLAIPHEVDDPATGVLTGPALWDKRRKRSTDERLDHADDRLDKLVDELIDSRRFVRALLWKTAGIIALVVSAYLYGRHG